jgi:hypothetical protein
MKIKSGAAYVTIPEQRNGIDLLGRNNTTAADPFCSVLLSK